MHPRQRKADGTYTDPVPFNKKELIDIDNAEHQRSLSGLFVGKSLAIEDKNGNEITVKNLRRFCRENEYSDSSLSHFKCGKVKRWYNFVSIKKAED